MTADVIIHYNETKRQFEKHDRRQGRYCPLREFNQWRKALRPKEKGESDVRNGTNEIPQTSENLACEWQLGQRNGWKHWNIKGEKHMQTS